MLSSKHHDLKDYKNGAGECARNVVCEDVFEPGEYLISVQVNWDGTTELKKLKPAKFNFINEKDTIQGFLAHEVSEVVPLAVTGEKDQVNKDGEPEYQSMDASKLVPLLVKTIQELEARIAKLEGE